MFKSIMSRLIAGIAGVVLLAVLSAAIAGCGGDKQEAKKEVAVRTKQPVTPAPVAPPAEVAQTPVPVTPPAAPEPPREVTFEESEAAYFDGRYTEATELFTRYAERKPDNPWGHYMLGLSAWKAGSHESAEQAFERSLALDRGHVKSWLNLSRVLLDTSRPEEALASIDEAVALDPQSGTAYRLRGRALHQIGRTDDAIGAYRRALQLDPRDAWAMNNLALVLIEGERFEEALPALARAVEVRDDVAVFFNNLGMALERTGHFRAAEEAYAKATALDATHEKAAEHLARIAEVREDLGVVPVDLAALAQRFAEEIEGTSTLASDTADDAATDAIAMEPSTVLRETEADSTGTDPR
jgi:Flp pilus assembly protein TadD